MSTRTLRLRAIHTRVPTIVIGSIVLSLMLLPKPAYASHGYTVSRVCGELYTNETLLESVSFYGWPDTFNRMDVTSSHWRNGSHLGTFFASAGPSMMRAIVQRKYEPSIVHYPSVYFEVYGTHYFEHLDGTTYTKYTYSKNTCL